ncbi:MAG: hypothetical protein GX552_03690 [Chloroflexi bacterium]|jgi:hypothetical protein|nr:hypothetical protein [Chloroflexota bacterium]
MAEYEYGRIQRLADSLEQAGIPADVAEQIMEGGEDIEKAAPPKRKADWFRVAMERMDTLLDLPTRQAVRESCACCLGGKRLKLSKAIAKEHATLEERIAAANETPYVFGYSVTREEDGSIVVRFAPEGEPSYRCVCLPKAEEPISITYCMCCGGHIKHHLQIALGHKLAQVPRVTALSSGGTQPCTFAYTLVD